MARGAGKIDRRALRRPDEFITRSAKVIKYVQVNKKKVLLIVGGVLEVPELLSGAGGIDVNKEMPFLPQMLGHLFSNLIAQTGL